MPRPERPARSDAADEQSDSLAHSQIRADYDGLWERSKDRLAAGDVDTDPAPDGGSPRWGVSAIVRPTGGAARSLVQVTAALAGFAGPGHIAYGDSNLHTTVRSIEFFRSKVGADDPRVGGYVEALEGVARRVGAVRIAYRGLTASTTGVLAQGWDIDGTLQVIRRDFHEQLVERGLAMGPEAACLRRTAHASLMVFTGPLQNPMSLVEYIERSRSKGFGAATMTRLEIVRYERSQSEIRVIPLARIALRDG